MKKTLILNNNQDLINLFSNFGEIISDEINFNNFNFQNTELIIIFLEIDWDNRSLSDLYGLKLLQKLRVEKKLKKPILLCSFFDENTIFKKNHLSEMIKAPSHYFLRLPFDFNNIDQAFDYKNLDENTLDDIIFFFFFIEGLISEEIHNLKNKVVFTNSDKISIEDNKNNEIFEKILFNIETSFTRITNILNTDSKISIIKEELIKTIKEKVFEEKNYDEISNIVKKFEGNIKLLINSKKLETKLEKKTHENKIFFPWKVLFIDDEEHIRKRIKTEFESKGIFCEIAFSAEEAFLKLRNDKTNNITVVISDYRLLKEDGTWQEIQGYNILSEIYQNYSNIVSFFALTSVNEDLMLKIQQKYTMKVNVYSKSEVLNSFDDFEKKVIAEGEKIYKSFLSKITLTSWNKSSKKYLHPLKEHYKVYKNDKSYSKIENEISEKAIKYIKEILDAYKKRIELSSSLKINNIQEHLTKDPYNEEMKKKFINKLFARRVAIGLVLQINENEIYKKALIYSILQRNSFILPSEVDSEDDLKKLSSGAKTLLTTSLALSFHDIPNNLLIEEKNWIKYLN